MIFSKGNALVPLLLAGSVLGHGQVRYFITSTTTYPAADAYASSPDPNSPIRKLDTYGPAAPFTGSAITCGSGGNNAAAVVAPVAAGSSVTFDWGQWSSSPVMTYIAACPSGCANFKGDSGNVWVKFQQDGFNPSRSPQWAEQILEAASSTGHSKWTVQIPSTLPNGEYILRHEILGLHVAVIPCMCRGISMILIRCLDSTKRTELRLSIPNNRRLSRLDRNCVQIKITGGGNIPLPSGVAFPGAYQPNDPGILTQLYWFTASNNTYVIPGGPIKYPTAGSNTTSISSAAVTSSTSKASSTGGATSSVTGGLPKWSQCGGLGWTGGTVCAAGSTCTVANAYYSQCL
ncbi:carbohydrate-binding module family 1 protein [Serendipita vermifera MAFF 305830]|uniref:lytic cellulose monooxygenase (C4-dehydrogenating) n=1 Tax=Serendipita vermifera MAFF 305830 TaxID=933852 RepID=A0A0C2W341_SERVB|nr:carbohydrate-binding module family 1 protein [Serendipita vermifera MAFF 305830]